MAARVKDMPLARVLALSKWPLKIKLLFKHLFKQARSFYPKNECDDAETKLDTVDKDIACSLDKATRALAGNIKTNSFFQDRKSVV